MLSMLFKLFDGAVKRALRMVHAALATDTQQSDVQEAIPGLPDHLVATHILRSEYFDDPADLARLRVLSRGMRDAVAETGLRFEKMEENEARNLGCLSVLRRLQRQGHLSRQEFLCEAAARTGNLEELKALRADGWPWDWTTYSAAAGGEHLEMLLWECANGWSWDTPFCRAAWGGNLEVLQWARANGCPWNEMTCLSAAVYGRLKILKWLRANGCPWDRTTREEATGHILEWAVANGVP